MWPGDLLASSPAKGVRRRLEAWVPLYAQLVVDTTVEAAARGWVIRWGRLRRMLCPIAGRRAFGSTRISTATCIETLVRFAHRPRTTAGAWPRACAVDASEAARNSRQRNRRDGGDPFCLRTSATFLGCVRRARPTAVLTNGLDTRGEAAPNVPSLQSNRVDGRISPDSPGARAGRPPCGEGTWVRAREGVEACSRGRVPGAIGSDCLH